MATGCEGTRTAVAATGEWPLAAAEAIVLHVPPAPPAVGTVTFKPLAGRGGFSRWRRFRSNRFIEPHRHPGAIGPNAARSRRCCLRRRKGTLRQACAGSAADLTVIVQ